MVVFWGVGCDQGWVFLSRDLHKLHFPTAPELVQPLQDTQLKEAVYIHVR